ncbi:uncharacterized protein YjbK [Enterococcus sp. PF1-24]|uniref:CYTH domain-containing protein n=1 Tax=unclassified Enterococcus TaxID=2608891 RepID=UPI00247589A9|nr:MULTISPECIES: CYTH domain-containing protein [unclassified Enterococcus]MDH6363810.1 uncharacterized protein YjbK [Enterococcus sp. PFB1-1]MDH6401004.1 uncharacterized protein YjbK [Enterococcus sp. PF1-24]
MSENIEIEFKTLLTETEYQRVCQHFQVKEADFFQQTNVYYDTSDNALQKLGAGLRIRLYPTKAEATLKTPLATGLLETNDELTLTAANELIAQQQFLTTGVVVAKLAQLNVAADQLKILAQLTTKRAEVPLADGLLAIDESWYAENHDYELEMEVSDAATGKVAFENLLQQLAIQYKPAANKIARACYATKKQG